MKRAGQAGAITTSTQARETIYKAWRQEGRPIVPFLGAGVSVASGFPSINTLIGYFAKVKFYIDQRIFCHTIDPESQRLLHAHKYEQDPSQFLGDFGWPSIHQLNYDLWNYVEEHRHEAAKSQNGSQDRRWIDDIVATKLRRTVARSTTGNKSTSWEADATSGIADLHAYQSIVNKSQSGSHSGWGQGRSKLQTILNHEFLEMVRENEEQIARSIQEQVWAHKSYHLSPWGFPFRGDWTQLLMHLIQGKLDFVDALFSELGAGLTPANTHIMLAQLARLMGWPLILTINFDQLLEDALRAQGTAFKSFDIFRDASLPHSSLVRRQLSLLKLHGSAYGLRIGERLNYSLDEETRSRALQLIPHNALIVVIGFSGWERRMLQLLEATVLRHAQKHGHAAKPCLLWLYKEAQQPYPVRQLSQKLNSSNSRDLLGIAKIHDAATFLFELYSYSFNTHPVSNIPYTLINDRLAAKDSSNSKRGKHSEATAGETEHRYTDQSFVASANDALDRPIHFYWSQCIDAEATTRASWKRRAESVSSTVSHEMGKVVTQIEELSRGAHIVIWIDMQRHYTAAGVINEVLVRLRQYDPAVQPLLLPAESRPPNSNYSSEHRIRRAVSRVHDALRRGKYVIAFDCIESFGRWPTVHHGTPAAPRASETRGGGASSKYIHQQLQREVDDVLRFLRLLCVICDRQGDRAATPNEAIVRTVAERIGETYLFLAMDIPSLRHRSWYFKKTAKRQYLEDRWKSLANFKNDFCDAASLSGSHVVQYSQACPATHEAITDWGNLGQSIHQFLSHHRLMNGTRNTTAEDVDSATQSGLLTDPIVLSIMSVARQPRSVVLLRSLLAEFVRTSVGTVSASVDSRESHKEIDACLARIVQNSGGRVGVSEGGVYWIDRAVHEQLYDELSTPAHKVRVERLCKNRKARKEEWARTIECLTFLSGVHHRMWRYYYTGAYLPSRDVTAFFEYVYHRISCLRYLRSLQLVLNSPSIPRSVKLNEELFRYCSQFLSSPSALGGEGNLPRAVGRLKAEPGPGPNGRVNSHSAARSLSLLIREKRLSEIRALRTTLFRERSRVLSLVAPDTWIKWTWQVREVDLDSVVIKDGSGALEQVIRDERRQLERDLTDHESTLLREKGDYDKCISVRLVDIARIIEETLTDKQAAECLSAIALGELQEVKKDGKRLYARIVEAVESLAQRILLRSITEGVFFDLCQLCFSAIDIYYCMALQGEDSALLTDTTGIKSLIDKLQEYINKKMGIPGSARARVRADSGAGWSRLRDRMVASLDQLKSEHALVRASSEIQHADVWSHKRIGAFSEPARQALDILDRNEEIARSARYERSSDYFMARGRFQLVRARCLFLRREFYLAHQTLDAALAVMHSAGRRGWFFSAMAHLFRAEVHLLSTDEDFRPRILGGEKHGHRLQADDGRIDDDTDGASMLKSGSRLGDKLDAAQIELSHAENLFLKGRRDVFWWYTLCSLKAQVAVEKLLWMLGQEKEVRDRYSTVIQAFAAVERVAKSGLSAIHAAIDSCDAVWLRPDKAVDLFSVTAQRQSRALVGRWIMLCICYFYSCDLLCWLYRDRLPGQLPLDGPSAREFGGLMRVFFDFESVWGRWVALNKSCGLRDFVTGEILKSFREGIRRITGRDSPGRGREEEPLAEGSLRHRALQEAGRVLGSDGGRVVHGDDSKDVVERFIEALRAL